MSEEIRLYRPSNGTSGDMFMSSFCNKCIKFPNSMDAENQCQILGKTFIHDIEDPEYPKQWCYIDDIPVCTAFKDREDFNRERREKSKPNKDKQTIDIFEI